MKTLIVLALTINVVINVGNPDIQLTTDPPLDNGIKAGETVTFTCKWTPDERYKGTFQFAKVGGSSFSPIDYDDPPYNDIVSTTDPSARVYYKGNNQAGLQTLTIKDVTKADEHDFICTVTEHGSSPELITLSVIENNGDNGGGNNGDDGEKEVVKCYGNTRNELKGPDLVIEECAPGVKFCTSPVYNSEMKLSEQAYGCGQCGDNIGITCEQCEMKPGLKPCNVEKSTPNQEVVECYGNTRNEFKDLETVECAPGVTFCTSPVYLKGLGLSEQAYGCGKCGDNIGITCEQCESKPGLKPCNKEVFEPDEDAYSDGNVMMLNTLLLPLLLALWAL